MPLASYALEVGQRKRLEIDLGDKQPLSLTVRLDGTELGKLEGWAALKQGRMFSLPDGSSLFVALVRYGIGPALKLERNGVPLPGAPLHPSRIVSFASVFLLVMGALHVAGWLLSLSAVPQLRKDGLVGSQTLLIGLGLLALGLLSRRRTIVGTLAFGLAGSMIAVDISLRIYENIQAGGSVVSRGVLLKLLFCYWMIQAALAQRRHAAPAPNDCLTSEPPATPNRKIRGIVTALVVGIVCAGLYFELRDCLYPDSECIVELSVPEDKADAMKHLTAAGNIITLEWRRDGANCDGLKVVGGVPFTPRIHTEGDETIYTLKRGDITLGAEVQAGEKGPVIGRSCVTAAARPRVRTTISIVFSAVGQKP